MTHLQRLIIPNYVKVTVKVKVNEKLNIYLDNLYPSAAKSKYTTGFLFDILHGVLRHHEIFFVSLFIYSRHQKWSKCLETLMIICYINISIKRSRLLFPFRKKNILKWNLFWPTYLQSKFLDDGKLRLYYCFFFCFFLA